MKEGYGHDELTEATKVAIPTANYVARRLEKLFPVLSKGANGTVAHEHFDEILSRGASRMRNDDNRMRAPAEVHDVIEFHGAKVEADVHNSYRSTLFRRMNINVAAERTVRVEEDSRCINRRRSAINPIEITDEIGRSNGSAEE